MDKIQQLIDRSEIQDQMAIYSRGVDRRDWAAVRATYHDDAHDEHGEFSGGPDEFIAWVSTRHASLQFAMHFLGNSLIQFADDKTAAVETYFFAMQRRPANGGGQDTDVTIFGRYVDRFEKREGQWRVAQRRVVYDNSRIQPSTHGQRKPVGAIGQRDFSDPIFQLQKQLGLRKG